MTISDVLPKYEPHIGNRHVWFLEALGNLLRKVKIHFMREDWDLAFAHYAGKIYEIKLYPLGFSKKEAVLIYKWFCKKENIMVLSWSVNSPIPVERERYLGAANRFVKVKYTIVSPLRTYLEGIKKYKIVKDIYGSFDSNYAGYNTCFRYTSFNKLFKYVGLHKVAVAIDGVFVHELFGIWALKDFDCAVIFESEKTALFWSARFAENGILGLAIGGAAHYNKLRNFDSGGKKIFLSPDDDVYDYVKNMGLPFALLPRASDIEDVCKDYADFTSEESYQKAYDYVQSLLQAD